MLHHIPHSEDATDARFTHLADMLNRARDALARVVLGQDAVIELTLVTLLCGGHGLLVGLPGLAKTRLVKALGAVLGLDARRIQFTPDLLPADILGSEVLETATDGSRAFRFIAGPVFGQLLMADEINRASPRTQSALLEAMQEGQVTVAGHSHALPAPFHVLATQNPLEQEGTYPLPEAQLDRFLFQIDVPYPSRDAERAMLLMTTSAVDASPEPAMTAADLAQAQALVRAMPIANHLVDAALDMVRAARPGGALGEGLDWGPGPRAGQALLLGARARALLAGRTTPLLDDLIAVAPAALKHRIQLSYAARARGESVDGVIKALVARLDA